MTDKPTISFDTLWVEKYRPLTLSDIILSPEIEEYFKSIALSPAPSIPNTILYGLAGGGKSSLALIIAKNILNCDYLRINASEESGIDTIRTTILNFVQTKSLKGNIKVVILEEAESLSYSSSGGRSGSQNALKQMMEDYSDNARFIFTTNNIKGLIEPIISRCVVFNLTPTATQITKRVLNILKEEKILIPANQKEKFFKLMKECSPDYRKAINFIQKYSLTGELSIPDKNESEVLAYTIYSHLESKKSLFDLRKTIIAMESGFGGDYRSLLKELFNVYYNSAIVEAKKKIILLTIIEGLYDDNQVIDRELNFFGILIRLEQIL